jgi:phage tail sheath protein FI
MPPTLSFPGVYIVEKASGVRTITGVATSITAFLGRTSKGPINKPVRCLGVGDFVRTFGPPHPDSELSASVSLFYANGGTDCYVVRLAKGATKASVVLKTYAGVNALIAEAKEEGGFGNGLRLEVDYDTGSPEESFNLRVILEDGGQAVATENHTGLVMDPGSPRFAPDFVTQSSTLISLKVDQTGLGDPTAVASFYNTIGNSFAGFSLSRRSLGATVADVTTTFTNLLSAGFTSFDISVDGSPYVTVAIPATFPVAATFAAMGTELKGIIDTALLGTLIAPAPAVTVSFVDAGAVGRVLRIESAVGNQSSVRIRRASQNDIAEDLMLGTDLGGIEATRWSNFRPAATGTMLRLVDNNGQVANLHALAALRQDAFASFTIEGTPVSVSTAPNSVVTTAPADLWQQDAVDPLLTQNNNNNGVLEKLQIVANAINADNNLPYRAARYGYTLVLLAKTGDLNKRPMVPLGLGHADFTGRFIINVRQYALGGLGAGGLFSVGTIGLDGTAPDYGDYVGNQVSHTGFYALDGVDLFNMMVLPGDKGLSVADRDNLWNPASNYCRSRRAFLLIDSPDAWTSGGLPSVIQNQNEVNKLRQSVDKEHSAVFYPKIRYRDGSKNREIGASGALAGLFARTDSTRGVWKAPAGTEADLRGITGLNVNLTDLENGVLNKLGVNCLRVFPVGNVNWGARTMAGLDDLGSEWKYIPIRRLALFLEETLFRATQWVVFEPNDEPLWANIRLNIRAFMNGLFRQGAFQGSTPDQAFYVKCDGETTTQADRNLGIVNIEIGFAPLKPAEFVVITIQQIVGDLS